MRRLAMRFNGILRGKRSAPLDAWIDDAIDSDLIPIMRFARVLRRDTDAVNNAIELPWSNGQAEGQINRLKTLKRAMYRWTNALANDVPVLWNHAAASIETPKRIAHRQRDRRDRSVLAPNIFDSNSQLGVK
jgi:hypothetical protein